MSDRTTIASSTGAGLREEPGQTMAEYGVVLTVVTIGIVAALALFSGAIERSILRAVALIP